MKKTYMLDTNICSFIMRERPETLLKVLQGHVENKDRLVISAITYAELRFGAIGKKASPKHNLIVDQFMERVDAVLPWDKAAVETTATIKRYLAERGTPIGANDAAIAGNAIAAGCVLVTNNTREFERVPDLRIEDWSA
ncbi:PIN domain-containing protein [Alkalimonas delamerensis]|uniref:Ribonuclease VapC n=1 Tax=Alkalimonas delamerensis TaxID=265981 RepID=A0ABT9GSW7_9GAMM|nr:PIN domain-containing protein [Alkalimonas delamerensis]MDP4530069.1 PIN domain-containing protein [Alkalimonas delamerensis]